MRCTNGDIFYRAPARRSKQRPFTPEDLLKFRFLGDPQISPDGSRILFTRKHAGEKNEFASNLWMVETSRENKPRTTATRPRRGRPATGALAAGE